MKHITTILAATLLVGCAHGDYRPRQPSVAGDAVTGAVLGALTGAAIGSFSGNAGRGALIGAGAGGATGLTVGLLRSREPAWHHQTYQPTSWNPQSKWDNPRARHW